VSITINSNLAASQSSLSLKRASDRLSKSIQRLSSGNRIVSPSEDAGGLAVAMKLESSLRRASATMMNTQNGVSFLQMQDGALKVVGEIVDRMSELKSFYNDVSKNDEDRENYNFEFRELQKELASLKSQKFNGVSLFATDSAFGGGINIMTSDDGLGDPIELSRLGLFENLKSKFGADGKLNSGSNGSYRQLVGDYAREGGYAGFDNRATRDYQEGDIVYLQSENPEKSGYFMALRAVASGVSIEDSGDLTSNWIRVADKSGNGFSEAYPDAPSYDMRNLQFNGKGEAMAYLKGDIIKVQAHWNDPNSFVFLQAQNDVPQNILIDQLLINGIGTGKYFDFIGRDQTNDQKGKPTSQFGLPNHKYSTPKAMTNGVATELRSVMDESGATYTPSFVQDGDDIYRPLKADWEIKAWNNEFITSASGDLVYDVAAPKEGDGSSSFIYKLSDNFKGSFVEGSYKQGDLVFNDGSWFKAAVDGDAKLLNGQVLTEKLGVIDSINPGDVIADGAIFKTTDGTTGVTSWFEVNHDSVATNLTTAQLPTLPIGSGGTIALVDGVLSKIVETNVPNIDANGDPVLDAGGNQTFTTEFSTTEPTFDDLVNANAVIPLDVSDSNDKNLVVVDGKLWTAWENPIDSNSSETSLAQLAANGLAEDVTDDYSNLGNKEVWTKSYFGGLNGISINTDYERGDNIFYQGKHYVYVSDRPSSDEIFGGEAGVNDFQKLLLGGAIKELGVYVDTIGAGGSSDKSKDSFYAANQDLEFVDRLPDSGEVRLSGVQRRGDPMQNGDGIFNTLDDQLYNALNAGNDGIFGTMDDFYSTTPYSEVASSAGHTDADADNNRDLLDTANDLGDFSVADFVDYIQTVANFRAVNGGTMSRLNYANRILEENRINLESAHGRIMNADIALESSKLARQNVLIQASAAMITQANQMNQIVLQLLQ
jgi:flagellin-like hook-associated protein FlgL